MAHTDSLKRRHTEKVGGSDWEEDDSMILSRGKKKSESTIDYIKKIRPIRSISPLDQLDRLDQWVDYLPAISSALVNALARIFL